MSRKRRSGRKHPRAGTARTQATLSVTASGASTPREISAGSKREPLKKPTSAPVSEALGAGHGRPLAWLLGAGLLLSILASSILLVPYFLRPRTASAVPLATFYHPPRDGTPLQTMAQSFSSLIFTRGDESSRDWLRQEGFNGPALQYLMANETSGPPDTRRSSDRCGAYPYYQNNVSGISADFCGALRDDERNFLHNGKAELLYSTQSWQEDGQTRTATLYLMNPGAPGWRAYFSLKALENLQTLGYAGLLLDNVDLTLERGKRREVNSDGVVAEYPDDAAYRVAVRGYLEAVRAKIGNALLWGNLPFGGDVAPDWVHYLPYLDGLMQEYFVARWEGTYANPPTWDAQLYQAETVLRQGRSFLAVAHGPRTDTARMRFALASFLLIADRNAYFRYTDAAAYDESWLYDDYQVRLGRPTGQRFQADGVWRREYDCGHVTVDVPNREGSLSISQWRGLWRNLLSLC